MTDRLVLRGGTVFDGLGTPGRRGDVLVEGGKVRDIGAVEAAGAREIDCDGLYVTPGFIDAHSHSDLVPGMDEPQPFKLFQGVTTEIAGNCGFSFAPLTPDSAVVVREMFGELAGGVEVPVGSFAEFLDTAQRDGPTNHMAYLVGHHTLRLSANGADEELRPGAVETMRDLAAEAFEAGAVGFSTGLIYPPGCFADRAEVEQIARVAGVYGRIYATHMRDEGRFLEDAIDEAVAIAQAGGIRLQISHCKAAGLPAHGKARALLERIERARLDGVDVVGDQYPYLAGGTVMLALLPNAAAAGGGGAMKARLSDPLQRAQLRKAAERGNPGDGMWASTEAAKVIVTTHADTAVVGRTLAEVAGPADPFDTLCDLLVADPAAAIVLEMMVEDDVREIMTSPLVGVGSDNGPPVGLQHPRTYGCFPWLLGTYVRDEKVLSWEEAIRKATSLIARQFGLAGRGVLLPGCHADITVFDPARIGHRGSYVQPDITPDGIQAVLLEGTPVVVDGEFSGNRAGRVLKG
ncbi:N-acyl-D-amino-acid deacylase family protein [Phytoactinopolyspora mesophila]|uniref:Amidohydrolase family protein n=1 Tax=Phytoactinopolyspora mesophila TaxID=2650750 RepID=A0A7K3M763_9ACTN|nr:D-aminoacylase [Phytoactinopolyspora mesophila]NDL58887.1 amidohydrolase family protein [Phytoactinopolyspora mesophila]